MGEAATADEQTYPQETLEVVYKPPDGGWGWMVAIGCFLIAIFIPMLPPCFGILFSGTLLEIGASSTAVAWIFNIFMLLWKCLTVVVGPLAHEFGRRKMATCGAVLVAAAVMISTWATSVTYFIFSFSVCGGVGASLTMGVCFPILAQYFEKRRGIANAFLMAGISAGQFINAPFIRYLLDQYAYQGATLILGALILNVCVGAALLQPVEWHLIRVHRPRRPSAESQSLLVCPNGVTCADGVTCTRDAEPGVKKGEEKELTLNKQLGNVSYRMSTISLASADAECVQEIVSPRYVNRQEEPDKLSDERNPRCGACQAVLRVLHNCLMDLKILKSPTALILAFIGALCLNGQFNFLAMVPFAMHDAGYSLSDAAWCVSLSAITNTVTRLVVCAMADCSWFNIRYVYMAGTLVVTTMTATWPCVSGLAWLLGVMGVWGCGVGVVMGLHNLAMLQYVGTHNIRAMFGCNNVMVGISFIIIGPLAGMVRDYSGSYSASIWMLAAVIFCAFLLWVVMPAVVANTTNTTQQQHDTYDNV